MEKVDKAQLDEWLKEVDLREGEDSKDVVYGVSDLGKKSFAAKLNDFLIDHTPVPLKEKAYFFHLLAVMLDAGIPILKSLKILTKRTNNQRFRRVLSTLAYNVEHGKSLSSAMMKFPVVFDETEIGVIKSGEAIGHLDQMLFRLSTQLDKSHELNLKIKSAMIYPVTVLTALVLAAVVVFVFVIPRLKDLFLQSGSELPYLTKIFISISAFSRDYWWVFVILALGTYIGVLFYGRTSFGRFKLDYLKLKIPVIGTVIRKVIVAKFVRLLSVLIESGLPISKTLEILADAAGNDVYKRKIIAVKYRVEQGERISDNLRGAPLLFPDTVVQMLSVGENSASMGTISHKLAVHYEREVDHSIRRLTTMFEPLMIVFVGLAVALMAVAILSPIFGLSEAMVG